MYFIFSEHSWRILCSLFNLSQKALKMLCSVLEKKCTFIYDANMGAIIISTDRMLSLESVNHACNVISSKITSAGFHVVTPQSELMFT